MALRHKTAGATYQDISASFFPHRNHISRNFQCFIAFLKLFSFFPDLCTYTQMRKNSYNDKQGGFRKIISFLFTLWARVLNFDFQISIEWKNIVSKAHIISTFSLFTNVLSMKRCRDVLRRYVQY